MIKNSELINILNTLGFEWRDFKDSSDGSGYFMKVIHSEEELGYVRFYCFATSIDAWRVEVRNCKNNSEGTFYFNNDEVPLEDVNTLIRLCKINLVLE